MDSFSCYQLVFLCFFFISCISVFLFIIDIFRVSLYQLPFPCVSFMFFPCFFSYQLPLSCLVLSVNFSMFHFINYSPVCLLYQLPFLWFFLSVNFSMFRFISWLFRVSIFISCMCFYLSFIFSVFLYISCLFRVFLLSIVFSMFLFMSGHFNVSFFSDFGYSQIFYFLDHRGPDRTVNRVLGCKLVGSLLKSYTYPCRDKTLTHSLLCLSDTITINNHD